MMYSKDMKFNERINYSITESGYYVGSSVNMPFVIQAKSMDELKRKVKAMTKIYINHIQNICENDLFEYVDETSINPRIKK